MTTVNKASSLVDSFVSRKTYQRPHLIGYGAVAVLTKGGASGPTEITSAPGVVPVTCNNGATKSNVGCPSDIRCKHNILQMGTHPAGFGLYLYDYLPEFSDRMGTGKFFGVMAQEVLTHNAEAVVLEASGYYAVNYSALESTTVQ